MTKRRMPIVLVAFAATFFLGCSRHQGGAPQPAADQNWAILAKGDFQGECFRGCKIWKPSESGVSRIIHETRPYLEDLKSKTPSDFKREEIPKILAQWDGYACQIVGYAKNGKKLIHLRFFHKSILSDGAFKDWQHHYYGVRDGGADFWEIEYDCEKRAFFDFESNGYA
jgi:hypothetical protein